ncbi:MAG: hypothetical protein HZA50_00620 [Planctomycetes bacterium]|nr:hypothetical protein [Planctomycetota bacterium]
MAENQQSESASPARQPLAQSAAGDQNFPNACPCCGQANNAPLTLCRQCGAALARLGEFRHTVRRAVVLGALLIGLALAAWFKGMNLFVMLLMTPAVMLFLVWLSLEIMSIYRSAGAIQKNMESMSKDQLRQFAIAYQFAQSAGAGKISSDSRISRPLLSWAIYTAAAAAILAGALLPMRSFSLIGYLSWEKISCLAITISFLAAIYTLVGCRFGRAAAGRLTAWACAAALATMIVLTMADLLPK